MDDPAAKAPLQPLTAAVIKPERKNAGGQEGTTVMLATGYSAEKE